MASRLDHHHDPFENSLGRTHLTNIGSNRAAEMDVVPREEVQRRIRLRDIR